MVGALRTGSRVDGPASVVSTSMTLSAFLVSSVLLGCCSHVVVELQGCPVVAPRVVAQLATVVVDQL